jgi:hypothetical protein
LNIDRNTNYPINYFETQLDDFNHSTINIIDTHRIFSETVEENITETRQETSIENASSEIHSLSDSNYQDIFESQNREIVLNKTFLNLNKKECIMNLFIIFVILLL